MPRTALFLLLMISTAIEAQESNPLQFSGDFRFAYVSSGTDASDLDNGVSALRSRIGASYTFNSTHSFKARLALTFSDEFEPVQFTVQSDNKGLALGSLSFDEFYYHFKNKFIELKLGRFQQSIPVLSNAKRSLMRFQSNNISIHWSDGIYAKRNLEKGWYAEFIGEYQPRNHLTYPYQGNLDFGKNEHNITTYLALENRKRDGINVIQKGVGFFLAPNAYNKGDYTHYLAFTSRIAFDFPQPELLQGGSIRLAGEFGQNLNTTLAEGTIAIASVGINKFAEKHEFMVEFAKTDDQWLLANVYARNSNEIEFRYRFFVTKNLNFDTRFRIRDARNSDAPNNLNFFLRATYSL